ncbi:MAG: hypothetical protein AAFZ80_01285 [Cyanobacteria bacterium P01_A01_bin.105]
MGTGLFETSSLRYLQSSVDSIGYYLSIFQVVIAWAGHHPYWAAAIALLTLTLLNVLIGLASDGLKRAVSWVLRTPLQFIQWLLLKGLRSTQQALSRQQAPSVETQIETTLKQLDTLRQEEALLLENLKTLLASR